MTETEKLNHEIDLAAKDAYSLRDYAISNHDDPFAETLALDAEEYLASLLLSE